MQAGPIGRLEQTTGDGRTACRVSEWGPAANHGGGLNAGALRRATSASEPRPAWPRPTASPMLLPAAAALSVDGFSCVLSFAITAVPGFTLSRSLSSVLPLTPPAPSLSIFTALLGLPHECSHCLGAQAAVVAAARLPFPPRSQVTSVQSCCSPLPVLSLPLVCCVILANCLLHCTAPLQQRAGLFSAEDERPAASHWAILVTSCRL